MSRAGSFPKGPHAKVAWRGSGGTLLCGLPKFSGSCGTTIRLGSVPVADWREIQAEERKTGGRKVPPAGDAQPEVRPQIFKIVVYSATQRTEPPTERDLLY